MSDQCLAQLCLSHHSREFHCDKSLTLYVCVAPLSLTDRSRLSSVLVFRPELGPATAPGPVRRMWSVPGSLDIRGAGLTITRTGPTVMRAVETGAGLTVSADL